LAVGTGNFRYKRPDGNDVYEISQVSTAKDIDGDLIIENQEYLVYVVSYPAGKMSQDYKMAVSNLIVLKNSSGLSELNEAYKYFSKRNSTIFLNGSQNGVDFRIYDLSGKAVRSFDEIKSTIQVDGLRKGVYILSVVDGLEIHNFKLYIQE